jgi:hypothetical protein
MVVRSPGRNVRVRRPTVTGITPRSGRKCTASVPLARPGAVVTSMLASGASSKEPTMADVPVASNRTTCTVIDDVFSAPAVAGLPVLYVCASRQLRDRPRRRRHLFPHFDPRDRAHGLHRDRADERIARDVGCLADDVEANFLCGPDTCQNARRTGPRGDRLNANPIRRRRIRQLRRPPVAHERAARDAVVEVVREQAGPPFRCRTDTRETSGSSSSTSTVNR